MPHYRLSHSAQADIASILGWSDERFGARARRDYEALLVAALRDASIHSDADSTLARPELGDGVFVWHLSLSRSGARSAVRNPRHFLVCRRADDVLVVGRVLHDAMDLPRHVSLPEAWE